ncbi:MAG TPA: ABC-F family ATP-binding cassette domain-containing protein, partial [Clostridiales bacterium]|nr:ABC-F family ATP-binding cassette domain-containing protein [Clostridiales bacterium]
MLVIKNLTLYLLKDSRTLLEDFNFSLEKGQKVALIGEEGNGKSTLLKVIVDKSLVADYVKVTGEINKKDEIIGYLPQAMLDMGLSMTTMDYFNSHVNMEEMNYSELHKLASSMDFPLQLLSPDMFVKDLSGGEKIKFQLLCEMLKHPTLLLLDEPSNDLDIWSVRWLEQFIKDARIPVIFVSHDEVLLENCANTIIHIEQLIKKTKPVYTIAGQRYADYVTSRENRISRQTKLAQKEREEYEKKMEKYRRIYSSVQYALRTVSRGSPAEAKNLKDK